MDRKNLARSFLLVTVLAALSLQATWIVVTDELAGVVKRIDRSGALTMPILEPMIAFNLIATLALFLLPRMAQRATLIITAAVAATALYMSVGWMFHHELRIAPIAGALAALASLYLAVRGVFSPLATPRGPQQRHQQDPWRAMDEGIDPTIDE